MGGTAPQCPLDYGPGCNFVTRVAISEEAKFPAVSMATFRNIQALCGIFQYVLATTNAPQNSITFTEEKHHRIVTQLAASDKIQKKHVSFS